MIRQLNVGTEEGGEYRAGDGIHDEARRSGVSAVLFGAPPITQPDAWSTSRFVKANTCTLGVRARYHVDRELTKVGVRRQGARRNGGRTEGRKRGSNGGGGGVYSCMAVAV